jgi:hypothetical protein
MEKLLKWEKNSSMEELCQKGACLIVDLVAHVHWFMITVSIRDLCRIDVHRFHSCDCVGCKHMIIEVLT